MLNYHDTKKGMQFIHKQQDKMVCYTTSKAENKAIIYSNHLLYNQQSYSYLNIEKHPLCYKKSKSIDFTNLKYKSKSIFL